MALSRKALTNILVEVVEDNTDALTYEEIEDLSEAIADRLVRADIDIFEDEDGDTEGTIKEIE